MQSKLSLFPAGSAINKQGELTLGGYSVVTLARRFGTPLYVYHLGTIRRQIAAYRRGLVVYPATSRLTYAGKAFLCTALAQVMTQLGVGLDVASAAEIYIARQGGAPPAMMHLHGNNKSAADLTAALEAGVGQIVIDNIIELEKLSALAANRPTPTKVWLRVTPDVGVDSHQFIVTGLADSKFGLAPDVAAQVAGQLLAADNGGLLQLKLTGLHLHLGSHFHDARPVAAAIDKVLALAADLHRRFGWSIPTLCAGGGWGVPYHPQDPPMPPAPFAAAVAKAVVAGCERHGLPLPELVLEPGRSLVAQAGVALYTVGGRKIIPQVRTYVSVDGGLADNPRPALYGATYTALLANRATAPESETVTVAGPYCESGDVLIEAVTLPPCEPGDLLAVPVAGAYQLSMASNYNGALKPAVIFIDEEKAEEAQRLQQVQRRQTFADLVQRDQPFF